MIDWTESESKAAIGIIMQSLVSRIEYRKARKIDKGYGAHYDLSHPPALNLQSFSSSAFDLSHPYAFIVRSSLVYICPYITVDKVQPFNMCEIDVHTQVRHSLLA